jgi:hypothetical protein
MSKLTDAQLEAAIEASLRTAARHEAAGHHAQAAAAHTRAHRNREELRRREGLTQDPKEEGSCSMATPAAATPSRPSSPAAPIPNAVVPDDAVRMAEALIKKWGTTAAVRGLVAALNQHLSHSDSMDIAEAPRVIAMQRRVAQ